MSSNVRNVTFLGAFVACNECQGEVKMTSTRVYTDDSFSGLNIAIDGICKCRTFQENNLLCADLLQTVIGDSKKFRDAK